MRAVNLILLITIALAVASPAGAADFGSFSGNPVLSWNSDGRTMTLVEDFAYTDPSKERWVAPKDAKVDGASIPQILWSLIGGPYEGAYRNASIVHDTECTKPYKHRWQAVHEMFYLASRAGGEGWLKAKVMFAAVYHFGPRWEMDGEAPEKRTLSSTDDFFRMRSLIRREPDISLQAIEGLSHEALVAKVSDIELSAERRCGGEIEQTYLRFLDQQLSQGKFVSGSNAADQGNWENYLGCVQ